MLEYFRIFSKVWTSIFKLLRHISCILKSWSNLIIVCHVWNFSASCNIKLTTKISLGLLYWLSKLFHCWRFLINWKLTNKIAIIGTCTYLLVSCNWSSNSKNIVPTTSEKKKQDSGPSIFLIQKNMLQNYYRKIPWHSIKVWCNMFCIILIYYVPSRSKRVILIRQNCHYQLIFIYYKN